MKVQGGYTFYGQEIGILMLDTVFPRIRGDIGNANTFPFPVRYYVVKNVFTGKRLPRDADEILLNAFKKAAKELEETVSVKVVNVPTIKPLNQAAIRAAAKDCKAVVTAEEHNIKGGLGSAIAEALCKERKPIEFVGIEDTFGCSAHNYQELLAYFGLTAEHIKEAVIKMNQYR